MSKKFKILLAGDYMWPWYQKACSDSLKKIGCEVIEFSWFRNFWKFVENKSEPIYLDFFTRIQHKFLMGPIISKINKELIEKAKEEKPDVIWLYNVHLINKSTLHRLKKILPDTKLVQYANDNPFSKGASYNLWRHFKSSVCCFDISFAYRESNIDDYIDHGAKKVFLLPAYFCPELDYPKDKKKIPQKFLCDVVFAGHYENDQRIKSLEAVYDLGIDLKIYGGGWNALLKSHPSSPLIKLLPIEPAVGEDYINAICGSKIALCFLSSLNEDTYTRRCFQIPAMRTTLLSQHSDYLEELFTENQDIIFFKNEEELCEKVKFLLKNEDILEQISKTGFKNVLMNGHDNLSRMRYWLDIVKNN